MQASMQKLKFDFFAILSLCPNPPTLANHLYTTKKFKWVDIMLNITAKKFQRQLSISSRLAVGVWKVTWVWKLMLVHCKPPPFHFYSPQIMYRMPSQTPTNENDLINIIIDNTAQMQTHTSAYGCPQPIPYPQPQNHFIQHKWTSMQPMLYEVMMKMSL